MEKILEWLYENKEWIFSGIGESAAGCGYCCNDESEWGLWYPSAGLYRGECQYQSGEDYPELCWYRE